MSDDLSIPRTPVYRTNHSRGGPDPMTRRLIWIAGGLAGALAVIVVLWSSVGHHGGPVPVVPAEQQPVRVKPEHPGGMQIPGLSADTGSADATASTGRLAPPPETPNPQALANQTRAAAAAGRPVPTPPAAAPRQQATASPRVAAKLAPVATVPARGAATIVPEPGAAATPAAPSDATTPAERRVATTAAERRAAATAAQGPAGRTQVQLAAVTSEAAARHEWDRLARRMPDVLGSRHPMFSKIEHDGHTLWRVRTGAFTTEAEASQFCREVRAKGAGCTVAAF